MEKSTKGIIVASVIGSVIVIGAIVFLVAPGYLLISIPSTDNSEPNETKIASTGAPEVLLTLLQGDEDSSTAVAQYKANNTEPIQLASGAHIRFDSPDYRTAESMRVIARGLDDGSINLLRKSYDVNNEFFINVDKGRYELQVQASWFERGGFMYIFKVNVV